MHNENPVERKIRQMVSRIVRRFDPEKIILFGSHARGDAEWVVKISRPEGA